VPDSRWDGAAVVVVVDEVTLVGATVVDDFEGEFTALLVAPKAP
jgi:hypothetical protein